MAGTVYMTGIEDMIDATASIWATSVDRRCALFITGTSIDCDHDALDDLTPGTYELSGGNYVRGTLAGESITVDTTNDWLELDATDQTFSALQAAAGDPVYAVVYVEGAGDSTRYLTATCELTTPPSPNGGDYVIQWSGDGVMKYTC